MRDDDRQWIERLRGGAITDVTRVTSGRSRATWLVDLDDTDAGAEAVVLRRDTGDGPLSGTVIDLGREAEVYEALRPTDVPCPALLGRSDDGLALLVARAPGQDGVSPNDTDVIESFIDALAVLHRADVSAMPLAGFARPTDLRSQALAEVDLWGDIFETRVARPDPLIRYCLAWLRANAPEGAGPTVLCHGDVGPGNFLHDGTNVTALLDWEFAHLGDPMDDLAWLAVRGHQLQQFGDFAAQLRRYADKSGFEIVPQRIEYYRVLVLTRMAISCLAALDGENEQMDLSTYLALRPLLGRFLTHAIAGIDGIDLGQPADVGAASPTLRRQAIDTLLRDLGTVMMPAVTDPAAGARGFGMTLILMHLQAADDHGAAVDSADCDDLGAMLGTDVANVHEGLERLDERIRTSGADASLLPLLSRMADRQVALWPPVMGHAAQPLVKVTP